MTDKIDIREIPVEELQTRNGGEVLGVFSDFNETDDRGSVLCIVRGSSGRLYPRRVTSEGTWCMSGPSPEDIIRKKRKVKLDLWLNVYEDGDFGVFRSKCNADSHPSWRKRIARIHIEREVEEGEGLS